MKRSKGMECVRRHDEVPGFILEKLGEAAGNYLIVSKIDVKPPIDTVAEAYKLADSIDAKLHESGNSSAKSVVAPLGDGTVSVHVDNRL